MRGGKKGCGHTDVSNTYLLSSGTVVYVNAAGWLLTCITYSGVVKFPMIGGNTTIACAASAEDATHLDMKKDE